MLLSLITRVPGGFRGVFLPPLKPPSPPMSVNKCLIVRCCHDKRLRVFRLWYDCFSLYLSLFSFSSLFQSKWPFFAYLRNILLPIEILKIKIPEYSDPPSQYFFINKPFSRSFLRRRKVVLCHLAEWHILPGQVSINVPIDRITPGYRQVVIQFSVTNLTNRIKK